MGRKNAAAFDVGGSESSNRLFASPSELEQAAGLCRKDMVCGV